MTFDATVNPVVYEGGEPVFIDTEYDTWNIISYSKHGKMESIINIIFMMIIQNLYQNGAAVFEAVLI